MCTPLRLFLLAFATVLTGCGGGLTFPEGGSPPDDSPAALLALSGNGQQGTVGRKLERPLVVKLTDASSNPVEGAPVLFQFTNAVAGAEVDPEEAETNGDGLAWAEVRLGASAGSLEVEARVPTLADLKTTFVVTAVDRQTGGEDDDDDDDDDDD